MIEVTRDEAVAFRIASQQLASRPRWSARAVAAAAHCGIRDVPPASGVLGLHARITGTTSEKYRAAVDPEHDGPLVGVWGPRTASFLVPRADVDVFTTGALPSDDDSMRSASFYGATAYAAAGLGATEAVEMVAAVMHDVLAAGPSDKGGLSSALHGRVPKTLEYYCRGCKTEHLYEKTFRLAVAVAGTRVVDRGERGGAILELADPRREPVALGSGADDHRRALGVELTRRYVHAFGPTTHAAFSQWCEVGVADARARFDALRASGELTEVRLAGKKAWMLTRDLPALRNPPVGDGARLLPPSDNFNNQRDRETLLADKVLAKKLWMAITNRGIALVDGRVAGIWGSTKKGNRLDAVVEPLAKLTRAQVAAVEDEVAAIADLRGLAGAEVHVT